MNRFLIFLMALCVVSCSATGPIFSDSNFNKDNEAIIYIYRQDSAVLSGVKAYFYIDGTKVSALSRNGYSSHIINPGKHQIKMEWDCSLGACSAAPSLKNKPTLIVDVRPGQVTYLKLGYDKSLMAGVNSGSLAWSFAEIPPQEARPEISKSRSQL